ncbi:hypothetical protein HDV01_007318 [Terramyces sp. JEL0728]|nr:hypothetical protein HDV01_007318 [Terramyces sp. JEL0728]
MSTKTQVLDAINNHDYEAIAAIEDDQPDVLKSRIVSLIKLDKFHEALEIVPDDPEFCVEHAYILYKTDLNECVEFVSQKLTLNPSGILDSKLLTIQAQAYYKLEQFGDANRIYHQLDLDSDIKTNIMASHASNRMLGTSDKVNEELDTSYSFLFNLANLFISDQEYEKAITTLQNTLEVCQQTMAEQEYEQSDIDLELATIKSQLGLVHYLMNDFDKAASIFESVLEQADLDPVVALITQINLACLKNDQTLAQSLLNNIPDSILQKLNAYQIDLLEFNRHMVSMLGLKSASKLDAIQAKFKNDERVILLEASLQMKKKDANQAIAVAENIVKKYPTSLNAHLVLTQKYLQQSQFANAEKILLEMISNSNFEASKPGLISLAIWVLKANNKDSEAIGLIAQAQPTSRNEILQLADLKLKFGYLEKAKADFEELLREDPTDTKAISGYIMTLPESEIETAEQYLPYISENIEFPYQENSELDVLPGKVITKEQKKKRKRTKPVPKNFDPKKQPDPERWLPKSQRTGKKSKTSGFQGVALEGGGIGSTGSARIAGIDPSKLPTVQAEVPRKELPQPAVKTPAGLRKKKNKK